MRVNESKKWGTLAQARSVAIPYSIQYSIVLYSAHTYCMQVGTGLKILFESADLSMTDTFHMQATSLSCIYGFMYIYG